MGRSPSLRVLFISALLVLSFSNGLGRKVMMQRSGNEEKSDFLLEENAGFSRDMVELDYVEAGPNTNTMSGYILPPPSPPAASPHS